MIFRAATVAAAASSSLLFGAASLAGGRLLVVSAMPGMDSDEGMGGDGDGDGMADHGGEHDHSNFVPLSCNDHLSMAPCASWSSMSFDLSSEVIVPCGQCVTMDGWSGGGGGGGGGGDLALPGGLNVIGKLHFPPGDLITITTPHVFVQGELSIDTPDGTVPSPTNKGVEFVLTGTDHVMLVPEGENAPRCPEGMGCDVSKKPVVVAGGRLNVRGVDESCPSWVRLADVVRATPVEDDSSDIAPPAPRDAPCAAGLLDEDFEGGTDDAWGGNSASFAVETDPLDGNKFLRVSDRSSGFHGPAVKVDFGCAVPDEAYLLSYRFRLSKPDGTPTTMETSGGSHIPYINLLRKDVSGAGGDNDWITDPTPRGGCGPLEDDVWHGVSTTLHIEAGWVDPSTTSELIMYLNALDGDAVVDIDDVKLELRPASAFPSDPVDSCAHLLRNSAFDAAHGHAYPFAVEGGILSTSTSASASALTYASWTARQSKYNALVYPVSVPCLAYQDGAAYEFKASYRVHTPTPRRIEAQLRIQREDGSTDYVPITGPANSACPASVDGTWAHCEQAYIFRSEDFSDDASSAVKVDLYVTVPNDDSSAVDLADVSFDYFPEATAAVGLIPDDGPGVASCWGVGAEILVTSHTIRWDGARTATVTHVDPIAGTLTLSDPVPAPVTLADDPHAGAEIALLSRNVRFAAADDDSDHPIADGHGHGGHLIVYHTPAPQVQLLRGAAMIGFGQQGKMGRYPIHFHMCNSVMGSVVDKNVVRDSNQRCIVMHNTDMLTVSDNVAFNTAGHCYILEDGGETKNVVRRNLGATTRAVQTLISDAESDNLPATFWLLNPDNDFVSNVAAGSAFSGYWFEVNARVRGSSRDLHPSDYYPREQPLKLFLDNVAHSNRHNGMQTYPQSGYRPPTTVTFQNFKAYKNGNAGVFFHAGGRLALDGGYFADNKIGVDIDADHSDIISNSKIIGVSEDYARLTERMGAFAYAYPPRSHCAESGMGSGQTGIRLDAYYKGGASSTGTHVSNVEFSGFAGPDACPGSVLFDADNSYPEFFDPRNILEGLTFSDATAPKKVDLSAALAKGITDVAIYDKDGSLMDGPPNSFVVSDTPAMTADPRCVSIPDSSAAHCPGVCLRSVRVAIPYDSDLYTTIDITGTNELGQAIAPHSVNFYDLAEQAAEQRFGTGPAKFGSHRSFFVSLPAGGSYRATFSLNGDGDSFWPKYADVSYEDAPGGCGPDFAAFVLDESAPPSAESSCEQLIANGDAGDGTAGRWDYMSYGPVEAVAPGADGTGFALLSDRTTEHTGSYIGMAQHLDTRCFTLGAKYHFTAKVKLTNSDGSLFECIPGSYNGAQKCPSATLRPCNGMTDLTCSWPKAGYMITGDQEWNVMEGILEVDEYIANAGTISVYVNGGESNVNILMDDVSMVPYTEPPTDAPTDVPTMAPIETPQEGLADFHHTNADYTDGTVSFGSTPDEDTVLLFSESAQDATVMSKDPHSPDENGEIELTVQIKNRVIYGTNYQAALALFFAKPTATLAEMTSNDNGYGNFEKEVVATIRDKLYPSINHVWTYTHYMLADGSGTTSVYKGAGFQNLSGFLKLKRDANGFITGSVSADGVTWYTGGAKELPDAYKSGPLKVGIRIKKEWKSEYQVEVAPQVTSGGVS